MIRASLPVTVMVWLLVAACSSDGGSAFGDGPTTAAGGTTATGTGGAAGEGGGATGTGSEPLGGAGGDGGGPGAVTDFTLPGPYAVSVDDGTVPMAGCGLAGEMAYTRYVPTGVPTAPLVVLGHGFTRSRQNMAQMAEHMASYGIRVVTPDYCHLSLADTDHVQNGADQVALASALADGAPVIHAGYSAGGLAAVLAAEADQATVALLALDPVDNDGLGVAAAPSIPVAAFGIEGEPSSCNKQNNGGTVLTKLVPGGWATLAVGATHCDFEGPTGLGCTALCGGEGSNGQRELIRTLATAFVAWQSGADSSGQDWVAPSGASYQQLVTSGVVVTR